MAKKENYPQYKVRRRVVSSEPKAEKESKPKSTEKVEKKKTSK